MKSHHVCIHTVNAIHRAATIPKRTQRVVFMPDVRARRLGPILAVNSFILAANPLEDAGTVLFVLFFSIAE